MPFGFGSSYDITVGVVGNDIQTSIGHTAIDVSQITKPNIGSDILIPLT